MSDTRRSTHDPVAVHEYEDVERPRSRVSWGAILAGAVVALMVMMLVNLLTLGLGLQAVDPATEQNPLQGVGTGTLIGVVIANVLALFAGGWTAAKLANRPGGMIAALHGILAWAVVTILSVWLLTSAVGTLVSGVTGIVGQGLSAAGEGIGAVAPEAAQAVEDALADQGASLESIREEVEGQVTADGQAAQDDTASLVESFFAEDEDVDRQEVVDALAANTDMSEQQADEQLSTWESQMEEVTQALEEAQQQATEAAQQASDAIGASALWAFAGMLLGAGVAVLGAMVGRPAPHTEPRGTYVP